MPKDEITFKQALTDFTDVLYLTDKDQIAPKIKKLLKQQKLTCLTLAVNKFHEIIPRLDLIGTVVVDTLGTDVSKPQKLAQIIESLEQKNIGVILLTVPPQSAPHQSDPTQSQNVSDLYNKIDVDELWVRISVNLAYRKRSPGLVVKPATPPKNSITTCGNRLAAQLDATESLVENLSEQLRLAGLVQRDFLPAKLPNTDRITWASNFQPAEWVSGDIYDIARLDEQRIGFYVADVVGHSMPAALLTMFIKQALVMRQTIGNNYQIFEPAEVMKHLNVRMAGQKLSGYQFATCCYCLIDTESLVLTYARAGHPYPILIRDGQPQQLEIRGSLLGIFEQAMFLQQNIQLQSGDKLILYSDGAEPFIGNFDDKKGFIFYDDFLDIIKYPINELFDRFNVVMQQKQLQLAEIDDITLVGLEIT
ncbi:MAG: PP2C family protein-serine/threonine phosphatase [Phycisphaerae bacterium]